MNNKNDIKLYDILFGLTEASKNFDETDKNANTGLKIEKTLKEIREYLEEYPGCVKIQDKRSKISRYLNFYKEEIKRMSNENNNDAKYICEYFNWVSYSDSEHNPLDDKYKNIDENHYIIKQ